MEVQTRGGGGLIVAGGFVGFCHESKIQHITLSSVVEERGGGGAGGCKDGFDSQGETEGALDSFMHRLWLFVLTHPRDHWEREGKKRTKKRSRKEKDDYHPEGFDAVHLKTHRNQISLWEKKLKKRSSGCNPGHRSPSSVRHVLLLLFEWRHAAVCTNTSYIAFLYIALFIQIQPP